MLPRLNGRLLGSVSSLEGALIHRTTNPQAPALELMMAALVLLLFLSALL